MFSSSVSRSPQAEAGGSARARALRRRRFSTSPLRRAGREAQLSPARADGEAAPEARRRERAGQRLLSEALGEIGVLLARLEQKPRAEPSDVAIDDVRSVVNVTTTRRFGSCSGAPSRSCRMFRHAEGDPEHTTDSNRTTRYCRAARRPPRSLPRAQLRPPVARRAGHAGIVDLDTSKRRREDGLEANANRLDLGQLGHGASLAASL